MRSVVAQRVDDEVRVLEEIVLRRASTQDACEEFARRYPEWPAGVVVYADASARHQQTAGTSDEEILKDFFAQSGRYTVRYKIPRANPGVQSRVRLMNAKLKSAGGETTIRVDGRCRELMADFDEVSYVAGSLEIDKNSDMSRTHLSDALGYLVWQEFGAGAKTIGERGRRLV
jgi:hypothetical protein